MIQQCNSNNKIEKKVVITSFNLCFTRPIVFFSLYLVKLDDVDDDDDDDDDDYSLLTIKTEQPVG